MLRAALQPPDTRIACALPRDDNQRRTIRLLPRPIRRRGPVNGRPHDPLSSPPKGMNSFNQIGGIAQAKYGGNTSKLRRNRVEMWSISATAPEPCTLLVPFGQQSGATIRRSGPKSYEKTRSFRNQSKILFPIQSKNSTVIGGTPKRHFPGTRRGQSPDFGRFSRILETKFPQPQPIET